MQTNPLLDFSGLTRFDQVQAEHVAPAINELIAQARQTIEQLETVKPVSWDTVIAPLNQVTEKLGRAWGIVSHLNAVADTPEMRAAYNDNQAAVTQFWTELGQNLKLFTCYQEIAKSAEFAHFSNARQSIIQHALRDFRLGGAELAEELKPRYAAIQEQLAALSTRFSENVLDTINDYSLHIENPTDLAGLPEDDLAAAQQAATERGLPGYVFTLHFPSYFPLLQYADKRALRQTIYQANATKASELGSKAEWDNSAVITELIKLRQEEAQLLGYRDYAEVSLVAKMADTPKQVCDFLQQLAAKARAFAERDYAELRQFAAEELDIDDLQAWDIAYVSEKLRQQRYAFSENEVKQYFPVNKVMDGLFHLIEQLFSVQVKPDQTSSWHPDVRFYRIEKNQQLIGQFYLDLYARNGKRGGAWMDDARSRCLTATGVQTPVAYLVCNFTPPINKDGVLQEALLTHDDVITLFHEFGHGLHHMLTEVDELGVSGIAGVEWDAVELPSQFMENFCWEWPVLQGLSSHTETGASLPRELFDKMIAAKNFQAGLQTLRQVEFALFDMILHSQLKLENSQQVQDLLTQLRTEIAVIPVPDFNRFQHSFSHIFAGGYAAGYYSYKWAEVLSADAYAAFEEVAAQTGSSVNASVGAAFHREILAVGGSRPALQSFVAFRGREPSIDALLRHHGMSAPQH